MHLRHFINLNLVALLVILAVGCSKKTATPHISFIRYESHNGGPQLAWFKAQNPNQSLLVCKVQSEPGDDRNARIIDIPARGSVTFFVIVQTNTAPDLSVKVLRLVTVHEFTVLMPDTFPAPIPDTALEPSAPAPVFFDATLTLDSHTNLAEKGGSP
jgi:hypothetical protein